MLPNRVQRGPSLSEQVYDVLCENIITGKFTPGQQLITEHLAAQLGVSLTPVREALARIQQRGLVIEAPNGKLEIITLTDHYVHNTFLVRGALGGLGAELIAGQITNGQLATLHQAIEATSAALGEGDDTVYIRTDRFLYRLIKETANNPILANALQTLELHIDFIYTNTQWRSREHLRLSHREHLEILETFARRDPRAARQAMEQHSRNAGERIVRMPTFQNTSGAGPTHEHSGESQFL